MSDVSCGFLRSMPAPRRSGRCRPGLRSLAPGRAGSSGDVGTGDRPGRSGGSPRSTRRTATSSTRPGRRARGCGRRGRPAGRGSGSARSGLERTAGLVAAGLGPPSPRAAARPAHGRDDGGRGGARRGGGTVAGFPVALKWPNDLVVGDRKLAGLLAEADLGPGAGARGSAVGSRSSSGPGATCSGSASPRSSRPPPRPATSKRGGRSTGTSSSRLSRPARAALRGARSRRPGVPGPAGHGGAPGPGRAGRGRNVVGAAVAVDDAGRLVVEAGGGTRPTSPPATSMHLRPGA